MDYLFLISTLSFSITVDGLAINLLEANQLEPHLPNYCNDSALLLEAGLMKSPLGQFLGYSCSAEFYHCRWQSDGFRTYKKFCKTGLVYDTLGTQNCNFDFNIKGCGLRSDGADQCKKEEFSCPLSESCVSLAQRCDGVYDCVLEEDEQNCPMCSAEEFPCIISEQCIPSSGRCDGVPQCNDGTDEMNCEGCGMGFFHCLKSNQCIPINERCDGVPQCSHGEDELLCKVVNERFYICENRLDQVPIAQVCDNIENCPDGSDEKYCNQAAVAPHTNNLMSLQNPFAELMNQAVQSGSPQGQFSSLSNSPNEDYEQEEEPEDEELPANPLLPIAKFSPFPILPTTLPPTRPPTRPPTLPPTRPTTTRKPRLTVPPNTVSVVVEPNTNSSMKKYPFNPPGNSQNLVPSSVNMVSVTVPPVPTTSRRGKPVESITITTAAPRVYSTQTQQVVQVTKSALSTTAESMDELDQELIQKLSAKFSSNGRFSPKDILAKLESILNQEPNIPSSTGSIAQHSPIRSPQVKMLVSTPSNPLPNSRFYSRVRVTGKPSARKWRPSLSNNPAHRTTPVPGNGQTHMPVQFRQSDDSTSPNPVPKALKKGTEKVGRVQTLNKHSRIRPTEAPTLEADETYFTYDEHP